LTSVSKKQYILCGKKLVLPEMREHKIGEIYLYAHVNLNMVQCETADCKKVQYIGWIKAKDSYDYFYAADLVVFPGRHSVFWEQVAAQGLPMVVKHWNGTTHVDFGGNVKFLYNDSANEIKTALEDILENDNYKKMKSVAEKASENFKYSKIAKVSIET